MLETLNLFRRNESSKIFAALAFCGVKMSDLPVLPGFAEVSVSALLFIALIADGSFISLSASEN